MAKRGNSIPLNKMTQVIGGGCFVGQATQADLEMYDVARQAHRDDFHLFFFQVDGTMAMEVDFRKHILIAGTVLYIEPRQVHRIMGDNFGTLSVCAMSSESLNPDIVTLLRQIAQAGPLNVDNEAFAMMLDAITLCTKISERDDQLQQLQMKNSCNLLVSLVAAEYIAGSTDPGNPSRAQAITQAFRSALDNNFITMKRPADYASLLNISVSYLNESVKLCTGSSVSACIRERVILEARRMLYHSGQSVKQIADELGYDDYPYFSRVFTSETGISPLTFRNKNRD